jgi:hypothetical protein
MRQVQCCNFSQKPTLSWCQQLMKTQVLQWSIHFARGPIQPPAGVIQNTNLTAVRFSFSVSCSRTI